MLPLTILLLALTFSPAGGKLRLSGRVDDRALRCVLAALRRLA